MKELHLKSTLKSYIGVFITGILIGCLCRLLDYCPSDTLWSFSSVQTLFGFWIISNTVIVLLSSSNVCAGASSFLYMSGMTLSFYGLKYILGLFIPKFSGEFLVSLFVAYSVLSIFCGIAAFILYYWNEKNVFSSVLYALPVGVLTAETIGVFLYLVNSRTFLFQLLMNSIGVIVFGLMFWKKANSKLIYAIAVAATALLAYFAVYRMFI